VLLVFFLCGGIVIISDCFNNNLIETNSRQKA